MFLTFVTSINSPPYNVNIKTVRSNFSPRVSLSLSRRVKIDIISYSWMCQVRSVSLFISPFIYISVLWLFCDVLSRLSLFHVLSLSSLFRSLINLFIVLILSSKEEKVVTFTILKQDKDSLVFCCPLKWFWSSSYFVVIIKIVVNVAYDCLRLCFKCYSLSYSSCSSYSPPIPSRWCTARYLRHFSSSKFTAHVITKRRW